MPSAPGSFYIADTSSSHGPSVRPERSRLVVGVLASSTEQDRQLNERLRETLKCETPAERFNACVASTG